MGADFLRLLCRLTSGSPSDPEQSDFSSIPRAAEPKIKSLNKS